jgi:hypothetical protein
LNALQTAVAPPYVAKQAAAVGFENKYATMFELFAKLAIALAFLKIQHAVIGHVNILAKLVFDATTQLKNVDPVVNAHVITKPEFEKCLNVSSLVNKLSKAHPEYAKLFANSGVE